MTHLIAVVVRTSSKPPRRGVVFGVLPTGQASTRYLVAFGSSEDGVMIPVAYQHVVFVGFLSSEAEANDYLAGRFFHSSRP